MRTRPLLPTLALFLFTAVPTAAENIEDERAAYQVVEYQEEDLRLSRSFSGRDDGKERQRLDGRFQTIRGILDEGRLPARCYDKGSAPRQEAEQLVVQYPRDSGTIIHSNWSDGSIQGGMFFHVPYIKQQFIAPILDSHVIIEVIEEVARVTVRQRFHNPSKVWLHGVYVFPLPEKSAVGHLRVRIGARLIEGKIQEKQLAEETFREAAKEGRSAALLSSARPNVFSTSVANIAPGDDIVVEIRYEDNVLLTDGVYSYRFPLVVAPRYTSTDRNIALAVPSPMIRDLRFSQNSPCVIRRAMAPDVIEPIRRDIFGPIRYEDEEAINPISLAVILHGGNVRESVQSTTHAVVVDGADPNRTLITLHEGQIPTDRDFVVSWRDSAGNTPEAAAFGENWDGQSHVMLSVAPPDPSSWPTGRQPRDLILVLDKSGSMHGGAIRQAKSAIKEAISHLRSNDRFNIIVFDDQARPFFPNAVHPSPENVKYMLQSLARVKADGGTEMIEALRLVLKGEPANRRTDIADDTEERLRQIVFLTDGAISQEARFLHFLERRIGRNRLFTVGIGAAPNTYLMVRAAELGRGTATFIHNTEDVGDRIKALYRKLENPALTDLTLTWDLPSGQAVELYPSVLPDLYIGEPIRILARLPDQFEEEIGREFEISGTLGGVPWQKRFTISDVVPVPGVASLWAREKLADLKTRQLISYGNKNDLRTEMVQTALRYHLVTEHTSLVAVDETEIARPEHARHYRSEVERNFPYSYEGRETLVTEDDLQMMQPIPPSLLQQVAFVEEIRLPHTATATGTMLLVGLVFLLIGTSVFILAFSSLRQSKADL